MNIGDTIWVELNESTTFRDLQTGNSVDYSNSKNLGFGISFDKFVGGDFTNPGTISAANNFNIILKEGEQLTSLQPDRIRSFNFSENTGRYKFKIAIVPNQNGTYSIAISNAVNVYKENDPCTKASFKISLANTNQHLFLYEQNRPGYTPSEYERLHMYCFKVN